MTGTLEGRVALVTGAGSGIGRASAMAFAREGARVLVADISASGGEETVEMIRKAGGQATFVKAEVTQEGDVAAMISRTIEVYGRLDCAVNNAGIAREGRALTHEYPEEDWHRIIDVNLTGVWLCMKHQISQMLKQGGGSIVNISSIFGVVSAPGTSAYTASKHGVVGLTRTAALEYAQKGIRVNAVCPSHIRTPMVERIIAANPWLEQEYLRLAPQGRMGTPEEVAEAVVWLCTDAASFVTGHTMMADGGYIAQ